MSPLLQVYSFQAYCIDEYEEIVEFIEKQVKMICPFKMVYSTKVAVIEALDNAIEHGGFPIHIKICHSEEKGLAIMIKDSGKGFLVRDKIKIIEEYGVDHLLKDNLFNHRGRGIYMMFKTVNNVLYNEVGNEVSLII
ncbi:anti-sigma regulatory factor (Ser/Thr protein kinase) [Bacillus mesophilus]|uniref:ATP-binding protein n=1 Tax=Bacillus mesophilus TaxID=1808955 RepID=A0A6M0Q6Z8_9BACI|nr:ATP-binding protein [Bacillus mesophilus]MBM7660018.1 anti-sigma regulatory factor (Ser/Thr protein kinase) [Bacillus mesophilus]NEY70878.1 ATP-binding protein [Bacillus mesophilus]